MVDEICFVDLQEALRKSQHKLQIEILKGEASRLKLQESISGFISGVSGKLDQLSDALDAIQMQLQLLNGNLSPPPQKSPPQTPPSPPPHFTTFEKPCSISPTPPKLLITTLSSQIETLIIPSIPKSLTTVESSLVVPDYTKAVEKFEVTLKILQSIEALADTEKKKNNEAIHCILCCRYVHHRALVQWAEEPPDLCVSEFLTSWRINTARSQSHLPFSYNFYKVGELIKDEPHWVGQVMWKPVVVIDFPRDKAIMFDTVKVFDELIERNLCLLACECVALGKRIDAYIEEKKL